ncbi:hypothetical protein RHSIM_Rhsim12G0162900 [Rhododendron simsii]|uniref:Protein kinase domain-containing protein n=1 Tax=Rhododendron simsii TaxID=118357 RepID=A0A834L8Y5_RHOSS|nr:hypothetical protein RHSIM_Rhsim12G0162900 [Rhododendron simsii]
MARVSLGLVFFTLFLLFLTVRSESEQVIQALIRFMENLPPGNAGRGPGFGWNSTSDPCVDKWHGVSCDSKLFVKKIVLERLNLTGFLDASSLCNATLLSVLSLTGNDVGGVIPEEISNCLNLNHLYLGTNRFSGNLPRSLSKLSKLEKLVLSDNSFSGPLPDMSGVTVLLSFLVQNNQFSGGIPELDFSNLQQFNVSNNNLSGPIPDVDGRFTSSSFLGNPGLCGKPLSNVCPPSPPPLPPPLPAPAPARAPAPAPAPGKKKSKIKFLLYIGIVVLVLVFAIFLAFLFILRFSKEKKAAIEKNDEVAKKEVEVVEVNNKETGSLSDADDEENEFSIPSKDGETGASSLVVLSSPLAEGMTFKELLRAPAELVGRGSNGSLYKVKLVGGVNVAVKRVKNWEISKEDFNKRMQRIDQVKHPNLLPPLAYYCSDQEMFLVYEFQQNGSLFSLLHGSPNGQRFNWGSRVNLAAKIAGALAFAHRSLQDVGIAHGNLKSTNILLSNDMEPCISEYGLRAVEHPKNQTIISQNNSFKSDVYGFGVILLELLAGNEVQNVGSDLASWVQSVISEEQTVEFFDRDLVLEGASEERMVNLLHVALKCLSPFPDSRPSIDQVATIIRSIQEQEERSRGFERMIK